MNSSSSLRTSLYTIYAGRASSGGFLLAHGYTGAIDAVDTKVVSFLKTIGKSDSRLPPPTLSHDATDTLERRGYLTTRSAAEERRYVFELARIVHKSAGRRSSFIFFVTYDCDFACPYCFEKSLLSRQPGRSKRTITRALVDSAFEYISIINPHRHLHDNRITLIGGEPLLEANIDAVSYIVEKGTRAGYVFGAVTNGYSLERYLHIVRPGMIDFLQVTLDGTRETHNVTRRHQYAGDTFDRIVANIDSALARRVRVTVRVNTTVEGRAHADEIGSDFEARGWQGNHNFGWYLAPVRPPGQGRDIEVLTGNYDNGCETDFEMHRRICGSMHAAGTVPLRADFCGATNGMFIFDPLGDVYNCLETVGSPAYRIGTYDGSIGIDMARTEEWWQRNLNRRSCFQCKYFLFCAGGCPAETMVGNESRRQERCRSFPALLKKMLIEEYERIDVSRTDCSA